VEFGWKDIDLRGCVGSFLTILKKCWLKSFKDTKAKRQKTNATFNGYGHVYYTPNFVEKFLTQSGKRDAKDAEQSKRGRSAEQNGGC